jgi:hypothetical protein
MNSTLHSTITSFMSFHVSSASKFIFDNCCFTDYIGKKQAFLKLKRECFRSSLLESSNYKDVFAPEGRLS